MSKKITIIVVVVAVFAGYLLYARFSEKESTQPAQTIINVKTIHAARETSASDRVYPGVVSPRNESLLAFQVGGRITERLVEMGDRVEKGQVLMKIDPTDVRLRLDTARAGLEKARSDISLAQTNLTRYLNLFDKGAVSKSQLDETQNAYNAADAALKQAQASYNEANRQLGYTELKAENDGVIVEKRAEVAQVVAAGQTVVIIQQGDEMDIKIDVPEQRVRDFHSAENIDITVAVTAIGAESAPAQVRDISPQADPVSRTYSVKVSPLSKLEGLANGMTASVRTLWRVEQYVLSVPVSALYRTDGQPYSVWVVSGDRVFKRAVELGEFSGDDVQILSGLFAGDEIVAAGILRIEEGQQIRRWTGTNE
ncbi:MAG: efflux RND transporter periplasmic adaptor subunit [Synergistaceae bacterium]|nr:efflux RND transporter periplasmic adaptor subunit [Synergistaceae bacterium]